MKTLASGPCKQTGCSRWEDCPFKKDIQKCRQAGPEIDQELLELIDG